MAKIGARAGRCAVMPLGHQRSILAGNSLKISADPEILNIYYLSYLLAFNYENGSLSKVLTVTAQPAISIASLKKYKVALPSLVEQEKIVDILTSLDDQIEAVESKLVQLESLKKSLMGDLLTGRVRVSVD